MKYYVSIIVPVYNADKFLSKCIDSILNQLFTDWELLLIDDGSTDGSWNIIEEYASKDERIKPYKKRNGGPGSARNFGLNKANGNWILFVDADDYIDKNYIVSLLPYENDVDLVVCGFKNVNREGKYTISRLFNKPTPVNKNFVYYFKDIYGYTNMYMWCGPICKLFSRDIIKTNSIAFPTDTSFGEDSIFVATYLRYIRKIQFVESFFYNVVSNSNSITANINMINVYPSYKKLNVLNTYISHHIKIYFKISYLSGLTFLENANYGLFLTS